MLALIDGQTVISLLSTLYRDFTPPGIGANSEGEAENAVGSNWLDLLRFSIRAREELSLTGKSNRMLRRLSERHSGRMCKDGQGIFPLYSRQ